MPKRQANDVDEFVLREVIHRAIDALVVGRAPLEEGMRALMAISRATCPSPLWKKLDRISWQPAVAPAVATFRRVVAASPPPSATRAIFFIQPEIYMNAAKVLWTAVAKFNPDDPDGNYVSKTIRWPKNQSSGAALRIAPLFEVQRAAAPLLEAGADLDAPELVTPLFAASMGFTCLLASEIAQRVDPKLLTHRRRSMGITAGPAEAEWHSLGLVTRAGWTPRPRCWLASEDEKA